MTMKHVIFSGCLCAMMMLTSCYQSSDEELDSVSKYVNFNFSLAGVEQSMLTRAIAEPGHLLVIDKFEGKATATEKTSLAAFGLPLDYGTHELYFVAADYLWNAYSTDDLTVTWANDRTALSYVWASHLTLEVNEDTSLEEVTLPLVIANVQVKTLDKLPANATTFKVDAPDLCHQLDLTTMKGKVAGTPVIFSMDVSPYAGKYTFTVNLFTFVPTSGSVGDVALTCYGAGDAEIAARMLSEVPVTDGYISLYAGYFFSDGVSIPLSYSDDWTGTNNYSY